MLIEQKKKDKPSALLKDKVGDITAAVLTLHNMYTLSNSIL